MSSSRVYVLVQLLEGFGIAGEFSIHDSPWRQVTHSCELRPIALGFCI